ncbi:MAG TPA: hypothetical protein PLP61_16145, partial [Nocardioides sp.]|uniref:hypothetical protein n=1 Tax=Nocardioides sp. TaxID=35761 RepID=UPI002CE945FD
TGDQVRAAYGSGDGATWSIEQQCKDDGPGGVCYNPVSCVNAAGVPGTLYNIYRTPAGGPRGLYGVACLTSGEAGELGAITPALVFDAMRRLSWPRSELVVEPPGGETLVNLATNFYTTNTAPTTQTVTLLGQRVEIEATPGGYLWHWAGEGDDGGAERTASPGAAYPDLEVTHTYRDADVTVHPRVDTVYSGRYSVNGGPWTPIPQTLTVPGDPVALRVLSARPVLVG